MKCKVCRRNWKGNAHWSDTGKYCPKNNQSDLRIRGPKQCISNSDIINTVNEK